jgi:hypothetical protein
MIWIIMFVLLILVTSGTAILEAYIDTHKRPRENMFWCHRHGPMRSKHCLPLFPGLQMSNGKPYIMCPLCYKEGVFDQVKVN